MQINQINGEHNGICEDEEYFLISVSGASIIEIKSHFSYTWKITNAIEIQLI